MPKFDYLIVGAGLYGATAAHELRRQGKSVLVIEKRNHVGGKTYIPRTSREYRYINMGLIFFIRI